MAAVRDAIAPQLLKLGVITNNRKVHEGRRSELIFQPRSVEVVHIGFKRPYGEIKVWFGTGLSRRGQVGPHCQVFVLCLSVGRSVRVVRNQFIEPKSVRLKQRVSKRVISAGSSLMITRSSLAVTKY